METFENHPMADLNDAEAAAIVGGAVAPLVATLLVPLTYAVGMAVDLGYLALTESQVQRGGDSAALAGVPHRPR